MRKNPDVTFDYTEGSGLQFFRNSGKKLTGVSSAKIDVKPSGAAHAQVVLKVEIPAKVRGTLTSIGYTIDGIRNVMALMLTDGRIKVMRGYMGYHDLPPPSVPDAFSVTTKDQMSEHCYKFPGLMVFLDGEKLDEVICYDAVRGFAVVRAKPGTADYGYKLVHGKITAQWQEGRLL